MSSVYECGAKGDKMADGKRMAVGDKMLLSDNKLMTLAKSLNIFHNVPKDIIIRTLCLWVCFFSIALTDSVRGPTLLEVRDQVGVSTQEMSYTFMAAALGGLAGCFTAGAILDRFSVSTRYLVLFLSGCLVAGFTAITPISPNLNILLVNSLGFGFFNGSFHTCANTLFLDLWKGRHSSPHMYAMHFFFGIGSLLSPIVAKPFLSEGAEDPLISGTEGPLISGPESGTMQGLPLGREDGAMPVLSFLPSDGNQTTPQMYTVVALYPLLGLQLLLLFSPLILFYRRDRRRELRKAEAEKAELTVPAPDLPGTRKGVLMLLMFVLYFCFAGLEISFRSFVSTFSVSMGHSRQVGSDITALFYTSYAIVRGMSIIGGIYLSPAAIMWTSQALCLGGSLLLSFLSSTSFLALQIGVVLIGAGTACLFATGMLWLKDYMPITNRIGSILTVGMNISAQLYCVLIGFVIDDRPLLFIHLMTLTGCCMAVTFGATCLLVMYFRKHPKCLPITEL